MGLLPQSNPKPKEAIEVCHPYYLDRSIFNNRGVFFSFSFNLY